MATIKLLSEKDDDTIIEYPINAGEGMEAFVRIYPLLMTSQRYEALAQEIKLFHDTFWDNSCISWTDCCGNHDDMEDYVISFFLKCHYIKPCKEVEELIEKKKQGVAN
jgi:hypothetical protein